MGCSQRSHDLSMGLAQVSNSSGAWTVQSNESSLHGTFAIAMDGHNGSCRKSPCRTTPSHKTTPANCVPVPFVSGAEVSTGDCPRLPNKRMRKRRQRCTPTLSATCANHVNVYNWSAVASTSRAVVHAFPSKRVPARVTSIQAQHSPLGPRLGGVRCKFRHGELIHGQPACLAGLSHWVLR
jgi:hypothetical protein